MVESDFLRREAPWLPSAVRLGIFIERVYYITRSNNVNYTRKYTCMIHVYLRVLLVCTTNVTELRDGIPSVFFICLCMKSFVSMMRDWTPAYTLRYMSSCTSLGHAERRSTLWS